MLRQPRYATLGALMLLVALGCVAAGTWQIFRYEQKRHENDYLRANAHRTPVPVARLLPVIGGRAPRSRAIEFRAVRATGHYEESHQSLVRSRTLDDDIGFLIVTPLRTSGPTLLVVRGFAKQPTNGGVPSVAPPPSGTVTITARLRAGESRDDRAAQLADGQVESINPSQQAGRIGGSTYNGFAQLEAGQPGTRGVRALPEPDLSNPAGGALEPQHLAYVIQWYLFAALALAAPVVMARSEVRQRGNAESEFDEFEPATDRGEPADDERRAARLADRYGRPVRR